MNLEGATRLAREGRLYPSVILHGGDNERRQQAALALAAAVLCASPAAERPCGTCRHCRRLAWPGSGRGPARADTEAFHPDFAVLQRDLKTVTSVEATRAFLRAAQLSPYEARGQVFVVASAESLSGEAANALLKALEEPHLTAPRNFLLLAPSRYDLLPTLRSRSLSIFLGGAVPVDAERAAVLAARLEIALSAWSETGAAVYVLAAADALAAAGGWDDPRDGGPWSLAARAVLTAASERERPRPLRRRLVALAEDLLEGPRLRVRGIAPARILEGLVSFHLVEPPGTASPLRLLP